MKYRAGPLTLIFGTAVAIYSCIAGPINLFIGWWRGIYRTDVMQGVSFPRRIPHQLAVEYCKMVDARGKRKSE
jgi:hypothetical protein